MLEMRSRTLFDEPSIVPDLLPRELREFVRVRVAKRQKARTCRARCLSSVRLHPVEVPFILCTDVTAMQLSVVANQIWHSVHTLLMMMKT